MKQTDQNDPELSRNGRLHPMRPCKCTNDYGVAYFQLYEDLYELVFVFDENILTIKQFPSFNETPIDIIFLQEYHSSF